MQIELNRKSDVLLVEQICEAISDRIRSQIFPQGSRLPSIRQLAKQLKVSMVTISRAYEMLVDEGLIICIQGKGTFVRNFAPQDKGDKPTTSYAWQLSLKDYLPRTQILKHYKDTETFSLSEAKLYPRLLPNNTFKQALNNMLSSDSAIISDYGTIQGDYELRKVMADYLTNTKRITSDPDHLLIVNGVHQGIDLIARSFIGPGDVIVTEAPTYTGAIDIFRARGAKVIGIPIDTEGMRVDILREYCKKWTPKMIYTVPAFHNPTGTVLAPDRRRKLLEIAQMTNSMIVEDDPWSDIYFEEKSPPAPIKSMDEEGRVIYLKGFSKTLSPGSRVATVMANGLIFDKLLAAKSIADLGCPTITQKVILSFLQSNELNQHLLKIRLALQIKRDIAMALLTQHLGEKVTWQKPMGGLNIWLTLPDWMIADKLLPEARRKNVSFLPGSACYTSQPAYNHIRLSFSYLSDEQLKIGVTKLCEIIDSYIKKGNCEGR